MKLNATIHLPAIPHSSIVDRVVHAFVNPPSDDLTDLLEQEVEPIHSYGMAGDGEEIQLLQCTPFSVEEGSTLRVFCIDNIPGDDETRRPAKTETKSILSAAFRTTSSVDLGVFAVTYQPLPQPAE